ncbi:uncharacterized protein LOC119401765 [Rhipicephalus sanguineus]|uniref:uncharacterized protein LOC119401765 n=1 Tax=Rhipicephalus sanguineus TaxID=34632 RepID=UPI0020C284FD|nr:uncharacterized protein LOC119401765 [Rhipicephalus sanguineus]
MLRFFASYSTDDVALGADAFRAPEMLDQPPPQSFRYQVNDEDGLRVRSQRIPLVETVEKDEGARKTAEASTTGPVDDSTSSNASFPSCMRKDASQQIARKTAAVSLAPERTLNPRALEHCTWKIPLSKRERHRTRMETSASSEQTLVRRTSIPSWTQVLDSRSNAFDEQLRASDSSEAGATVHVLNVLRQLLQRSGIPSQTAVSLLDEWPAHMNSDGIPLVMPGSDRVVIREIIEDPARTRLLLRNMLRLMGRLAASGRSLLSFERADEQLDSLMQRCSSAHENHQLQHRLQALPCGSQGSECAEPQTFLSPQQVDNFEKEVNSFLQHVQQFSEQAQLFYQQARVFVADFKAFQLRMEHFKQVIDNIAQAVPNSEARVDTQAPRETQDAQVLSLEELLGGFPFIEGFTRLIQSFSQRIFSPVQVTEASAATEGTHQQTARESSEERQAKQSSPQQDGNSRQNVTNAPTSRCSERSHRCSSPGDGDVVNTADKQVHCVFIKAFDSPDREREGVSKQVHTDPTENGDVTPCAEKSAITPSPSRASRNLWSPTGTTGKVTPSVFVFLPVASESTCSSEGSSPGPHLEEPGHRSSQDLLEHPSKSGEPQFPPGDSEGIVKSSSSQEHKTSPEDAQFSKDDYPPSPNALVKLWRSFSFVRKLSTKDETPQSG